MNDKGVVAGLVPGEAVITATSVLNPAFFLSCRIWRYPERAPSRIDGKAQLFSWNMGRKAPGKEDCRPGCLSQLRDQGSCEQHTVRCGQHHGHPGACTKVDPIPASRWTLLPTAQAFLCGIWCTASVLHGRGAHSVSIYTVTVHRESMSFVGAAFNPQNTAQCGRHLSGCRHQSGAGRWVRAKPLTQNALCPPG